MRALRRLVVLGLACAPLAGCAERDDGDLREFVATTKATASGKPLDPLPPVQSYTPAPYSAQDVKSPFAVAAFVRTPEPPKSDVRPDVARPREELEKYNLGSLKMVGTLERGGRWALVQAPDGQVLTVRPGNHLGSDYGRVVAIEPDRLELVEIVPDGSGGWLERRNALKLAE